MKKKTIVLCIIFILMLAVSVFLMISASRHRRQREEAAASEEYLTILKRYCTARVFLNIDVDSNDTSKIAEIENKLKNIKGIKVEKLRTREEAFKELEETLGKDVMERYNSDILPLSFIITIEADDISDLESKNLSRISKDIFEIEEVDKINTSVYLQSLVTEYKKNGIEGLRKMDEEIRQKETQD